MRAALTPQGLVVRTDAERLQVVFPETRDRVGAESRRLTHSSNG